MLKLISVLLLVSFQACTCHEEDENSLLIASFNIQIFGQNKIKQQDVVDVLLRVWYFCYYFWRKCFTARECGRGWPLKCLSKTQYYIMYLVTAQSTETQSTKTHSTQTQLTKAHLTETWSTENMFKCPNFSTVLERAWQGRQMFL